MIEKEIYQKLYSGQITREDALKLIFKTPSIKNKKEELSEVQKGIWIEHQMSFDNYAYNTPGAMIVSSNINVEILEKSLNYLLQTHPVLRTKIFKDEEIPYQLVEGLNKVVVTQFDVSDLTEEEVIDCIWKEAKRPFKLEEGPLYRISLFNISTEKKILVFNFHHIIFDGVSSQIFLKELKQCYFAFSAGKTPELELRKAEYADFIKSEKEYLLSEQAVCDREYWLNNLSGDIPTLNLPFGKTSSNSPTHKGQSYSTVVKKGLVKKLKNIKTDNHVTMFSIMMAAFNLLLFKYSNGKELYIGTPVLGRNEKKFENVLGCFMNMIVIKNDVSYEENVLSFLERVHETVLKSLEHSRYPYNALVKEIKEKRDTSNRQLFQAAFYFQNWLSESKDEVFLEYLHEIHQIGEFDLTLEVIETVDECLLHFKYNPDMLDEGTIRRLAEHYNHILLEISNNPNVEISDFSVFNKEESEMMLYDWNDTFQDYPKEMSFPELFIRQVKENPNAIAVIFKEEQLTYLQLYRKAMQLAHYLNKRGVQKGTFVGIHLERSIEMLVSLIAVQMAGGTYIPLDPTFPKSRLFHMFEECNLSYVISFSKLNKYLPQQELIVINLDLEIESIENIIVEDKVDRFKNLVELTPDDLAYVIFTSGSTGKAKGIKVHHGGLTNFLCSMVKVPGCTSQDYVFALTTICFDIAGLELYLPLVTGAKLEILSDEITKDGIQLLEKIESEKVTIMQATPATWKMLLAAGWNNKKDMKILCGGEALTNSLANKLLDLSDEVWNMYGPTETTIWSSTCKVERNKKISIGEPIANTQFYILDNMLNPVPIGVDGNLYIGGDGVSKGYINREAETSENFIKNPFIQDNRSMIYKTGDMARYLNDGSVEYLGRGDFQVKIHGFRIELGEIEATLQGMKGINEAVVVVRKESEEQSLVAFIISNDTIQSSSGKMIQQDMRRYLPTYMIPSKIYFLEKLPKTLNAKINRKELSSEEIPDILKRYGIQIEDVYEEEKKLGTLRNKSVQSTTNFELASYTELFIKEQISQMRNISLGEIKNNISIGDYGFNSILFTNLSLKINEYYGLKTNPSLFYTYSTIQEFTNYLVSKYANQIKEKHRIKPKREGSVKLMKKESVVKSEDIREEKSIQRTNHDIAIIGMSGMLPGSKDLSAFWNNILAEKDLVTTIPSDRWEWSKYYSDFEGKINTSVSKWGAFVPEIDKFDAPFFGISRREAELMDPQQRIMLESVWKAIEDAGYKPSDFSETDMGVFIGATGSDYAEILMRETNVDAHTISGIVNAIIPNRISYFYNFQGPSELIDTACSSSLVSVARAVDAIRNGNCKTAIAGGVNLIISPFGHIALSKTNMLSEDGRCKTFDKSANGYVRGEGGVVILLKSLEDAITDKDSIYAVIKGTAVNHGGKTNSLTAPSANAQEKLIISAVNDADINPQTIRYIEAHGTGTALGDPIEINGLQSAFQKMDLNWNNNPKLESYCGIGSVKTNIGHLEAAAGLAGLVKSVLSLKNKKVPASIHCKEVNPFIDLNNSPFYLINETKSLDRLIDEEGAEIPLRAGVSSFGFGGTNAHIVLEEYIESSVDRKEERGPLFSPIITISAKDKLGLKKQVLNILKYIEEAKEKQHYNQKLSLEKIAYTLQVGREPMQERLAFIAYSLDDLKEKLNEYVAEKERVTEIYTNSGLSNKETIESILDGEEINGIIERYVQKEEWDKLCKLWINGVEIDWMNLYSNYNPGRISLPTYSFNKERYWIPVSVKEPLYGNDLVKQPPLLGEVSLSKSINKGLVFEKVLSKNDLIVRDHVVNSQCVFPGTGYIETAIESFAFLRNASEYRVRNVTWFQPLIIEDEESVTLQLSLQEENGDYHFQIESIKGLEKRIHSKGIITSSPYSEFSPEEYMGLEEVKARCSEHISKEVFYNKLNESGINYGVYFQGIEEIWRNDNEALGKFKLSNSFANEVNDYYVHPVIMDCALQTMGSLIEKNAEREQIKLPFSVEEVHVIEPLRSQEYFAYVVNVGNDTHNIALLNNEGKVCVKFYNLVSREIKSGDRHHIYRSRWIESHRVGKQQYSIATDTKNTLYIYPEDLSLFKESLKKTIGASHSIEIQLSKETKQLANNYWEVAFNDENAYRKIIKENHIDQIYFLGGLSTNHISIEELQMLEEKKEHGVMALLYMFKALQKLEKPIRVVTITNHIFEVLPNENVIPIHAGISGFVKTASLECPHTPMLLVDTEYNRDMSLGAVEKLVKNIINEVSEHETGEVAIRDGKSYIRKHYKLKLSELHLNESSFRDKGVYLIAGAGGIGIQLASYLAEKVKAKLILVGRSGIDSIKEEVFNQIRAVGAEVDYIQADITNQLQMDQVVSGIKKKHGALHGVFHSAMVLRDIRIQNMTKDMFNEVLDPKVKGSIALFNAVKEETLDFMMLFSSTNAFIGNEGQSNYNTACSYQDAIASFLKRQAPFPIKVINWSFWGSIGAVATDAYKKQLNAKGLLPIEVKEGMELIEKAVVSSTSQITMFKAKKSVLDELNFDDNHYLEYYSEKIPSLVKDIRLETTLENINKEEINSALKGFKEIEEFGVNLLLNYFWKNEIFTKGGEKYKQSTLLETLKIIPAYEKLFIALLNILEKEGLLFKEHSFIYTTHLVEKKYNDSKVNMLYQVKLDLEGKFPALVPYIHLLWECVSNYPDILDGSIDHKEVMFPSGQKDLVGKIYKGNIIIDYYNQVMGNTIKNYIQKRLDTSLSTHINILEVGAGTGGTSDFVLNHIQGFADNVTYYYTDISPSFTRYGEERYSSTYPFATFKKLDIEKDFEEQGFLPNDFDIVLATNVLHATNDIRFTLQNIKKLLKKNGVVLINEITKFQNFSTLIFGLTEGWWYFDDDYRIEGSPLLTTDTWKRLLDETGYFFGAVNGLKGKNGVINQSVILAESDGEILSKNKKDNLRYTEIVKTEIVENTRKIEKVERINRSKIVEGKELKNSDLLQETKKYLKKQLEIALKLKSSQIKDDENFDQIGVDSLIIIELNKSIEKSFGKVASTLFFEYKTVEELAQYFVKEYKDKVMELFAKKSKSSKTNLYSDDLFEIDTKVVSIESEEKTDTIDNYKREQEVQKYKESNFQETVKSKDIAIIGVSGRYPSAENIDEYWNNLKQGRNCISEVPSNRWDWKKYYDPSNADQAKGYSKWGGFLKDIDKFDAEFFNINESHACEMDPQERLFLETTWSLLENAGYPDKQLSEKGEKVGVFVGAMYSAYGQIATRAWEQGIRTNAQSAFWIIPNRISHFFNFNGPSIAIDTACSSSLTAIHYASKSLNSGECSVAIAGGVNLILHPRQHVRLAHLNNLAKSDKNRSFSEDADGFVEGEGVGAVLLKPLDRAIQDNDYIYGVIKGTSVNSSGDSSSLTIPSISALENVVEDSIKEAGVHPETINYMEAHATGTMLGDPLEISALSKCFAKHTNKKQYCTIGSVKSNVGHLEAASGVAALTKVLLQLKYKKIVPSINISKLNSYIDFENSPFYVQEDLVDWENNVQNKDTGEKNNLRRAGISSFGAGGSNAHIIVEEYPQQPALCEDNVKHLIVFSAKKAESLLQYAKLFCNYIKGIQNTANEPSLAQIAYTLQMGRVEFDNRLAFTASNFDELINKLTIFINKEENKSTIYYGQVLENNNHCLDTTDLELLAKEWVEGKNIDWKLLYQEESSRIPLPTYYFDKKSYWINENTNNLLADGYVETYSYNDLYVKDHVSFGKRTLLGMTYCSLAFEAFQRTYKDAQVCFRNLLFNEPVEINVGEKIIVDTRFKEEDKLYVTSSFREINSENFKPVAHGEVVIDNQMKTYTTNIPSFNNKVIIKGEELYNRKPGVYGPALRTLKEVFVSEEEAWGKIVLTEEMKQDSHRYLIHPAILDGAIICRLALESCAESDMFIPLMIKEVCIYKHLPNNCYCRVQQVKGNYDIWEGNIELVDENGTILVLLRGVVCKRVRLEDPLIRIAEENESEREEQGNGYSEENTNIILAEIENYLLDKISLILNKSQNRIDKKQSFMQMGIDSKTLISLSKEIKETFGIDLYPTIFFEYPNISDLANYFLIEHSDIFTGLTPINDDELDHIKLDKEYSEVMPKTSLQSAILPSHVKKEEYLEQDEPIAIIGLSGIMPQSDNLDQFWDFLEEGENLVTEIPKDRWDWKEHYKGSSKDVTKTNIIWGGFMNAVDKFDPAFFRISPREARLMDPQH
ncbi:non-ribosomal peptide synthetase, partial [Bacillus cereus]|uniref:non-ribosomal peptide synthetase n=1 Tax=Bacillus cereus TaxID=1396 RepID=UPI0005350B1E